MIQDLPAERAQRTFYDRWSLPILLMTLAFVPIVFYSAGKAVQSNVNKVEDWLPKTFDETRQLAWFRQHFANDQFIIISWEGCRLGESADEDDPRIERLAQMLVPNPPQVNGESDSEQADVPEEESTNSLVAQANVSDELRTSAARYFKSVSTGRRLLDKLTSPPLNIDRDEAIRRLQGGLIGPDGTQSCVVVSLNATAVGELKKLLRSGQRRIFRPNLPAGVVHQFIVAAGIPAHEAHLGGPPVDNAAIDEEGERTLVRLAGFSGLLGLGLAWWTLRSVMLTMIVFAAGVLSAAASLGIVWLTGQNMDAILMSMPSLVYVLAISGAVHLINYYKEAIFESGLPGAAERAVAHAWKPALFCSTTTALGLVSLYVSELVPIQKFGLYSAIGMMTLLGILFLFLPAALHWSKIGKRWVGQGRPTSETIKRQREIGQPAPTHISERVWNWIATFIVRRHGLVMISCLASIAAVGWGLTHTRTSINLLAMFDSSARILHDYRWLEEKLGMLVPLEIVLKIPPESRMADNNRNHDQSEDIFSLSFLERMEAIARVQQVIDQRFGKEGAAIVGPSMSAVSFAPQLPDASGSNTSFVYRKALNIRLESSKPEFEETGFLALDPVDSSELWRISLRVAAFKGVDYGKLVDDMRRAIQPVMRAYLDRDRILKQIAAWSPEQNCTGAKVLVWDRSTQNADHTDQPSIAGNSPDADTLAQLLVNARCRVSTSSIDPASIPLSLLEVLKTADAVVLVGEFSDAEVRTVAGAVPHTILSGGLIHPTATRALELPRAVLGRDTEIEAVYTGVVPIVYKAQRALLDSLIQSTMWSFLTITPLMMFVSRGIVAGGVAMIPNVLPVVVVFGAMGWFGIPIDIGSMMTASIALGVAVDDTIHFLAWYRDDLDRLVDRNLAIVSTYQKCGTPTLQTAVISGLGLSVFALSTFTPTQRFGWLMLSILFAGVVSELVMLPALLAGPLGKAFNPSKRRRALSAKLFKIARYRLRLLFASQDREASVENDYPVALTKGYRADVG